MRVVRGRLVPVVACLAVALSLAASGAPAASGNDPGPSGGVGVGGGAGGAPPPPGKGLPGRWLRGVTVTEYWPAPESWFVGALVKAPGLPGKHRIDWLYSATGVSMQGEGIGLDGRLYHIQALGTGGWVTASGTPTSPAGGWAGGAPYWRAGAYWRNRGGGVTFPLAAGGWSAGAGVQHVALKGVRFARGPSQPLRYWQSIAVDPSVIPLGSRVYIPAYRNDGHGGWFVAQDTGGAISGLHLDVYRAPPSTPGATGADLLDQRVFISPPRG